MIFHPFGSTDLDPVVSQPVMTECALEDSVHQEEQTGRILVTTSYH